MRSILGRHPYHAAVPLALVSLLLHPGESPADPSGAGFWSGGGPKAKSVYTVAVDSADPDVMYAGALGSGVFKTTDGGASWDPSTTGLTNTYVRAVVIYPPDHRIVFAGTNDGLFKSTDAGITWSLSLSTTSSVRATAFDSGNPNVVYGGSLGGGIYKSTDQGASWQSMNSGLTDLSVRTIATHPFIPGTALAGSGTNGGVNLTTTGGLYWGLVSDPDARGAVYDIEYDPLNASRVYAGMFERGVNWTRINTGLTTLRSRALILADTLRYLGTDSSGVYFSTLRTNWVVRNAGLPNLLIRALASKPGNPTTAFAGTDGAGLYKTTDAGLSWSPINTYLTDTTGRCLLARNDAARTLVCGTGFGDGIWTSTDDGATWTRASVLKTRDSVLDIAETPAATTLYAAIYGSGVYASTDGGNTWATTDTLTIGNRFVRCLSINPTNPQEIMVGTGYGTYWTTNGGLSWEARNTGFPPAASVRALVRLPRDPNIVLAGTDSTGVYKTTDGGASWFPSSIGLTQPYVHALAVDRNHSYILVGTDAGLFRSWNEGASWRPLGYGLPAAPSIRDIVIDPSMPSRAFIAIWEAGVYRSEDEGGDWMQMNGGLPDLKTYSLALDATRSILFVGTRLRGVFAYAFPVADVANPDLETAREEAFSRVCPNPCSSATEIRFHLSTGGSARVQVFDAQGSLVRTLRNQRFSRGEHRIAWDGRDDAGQLVPSGVYWAQLRGEGISRSIRLTLVR